MTKIEIFDGEFDFLPFEAHIEFGAVPTDPSKNDFHLAVSDFEHAQTPASLWRLEAIRWRRANRGVEMDLDTIKRTVAKRLFALVAEAAEEEVFAE